MNLENDPDNIGGDLQGEAILGGGGGGGEGGGDGPVPLDDDADEVASNISQLFNANQNKRQKLESSNLELPKLGLLREIYMKPDVKCWGCLHNFGPADRPGKYKKLELLWNYFEKKVMYVVIETLAEQIQQKWEEWIYTVEVAQNVTPKPLYWDYPTVLRHLTVHMKDERIMLHNSLENYRLLEMHLLDTGKSDKAHIGNIDRIANLKLKYQQAIKNSIK